MRRIGGRNDWWDWGLILLLVACATVILWAGVWVAHSWAAPSNVVAARRGPLLILSAGSLPAALRLPRDETRVA
jgi:hypothetical protein